MLNRIVTVLVLVPIAIILIALAVANRDLVPFTIDPFNRANPLLTIQLPLFVYIFAAMGIGMVLGSMATWWKQGRYRKLARDRDREVRQLRAAELPAKPAGPGLPVPQG
ncbi:MAG: LapA family protein [Notoacmeibacter sp.]|nr:LapA family protein [Notoacmeibacter sp.]